MFDGGVRSLREICDGKQLVLNFWATWCGVCIKEMPDFERIHAEVGRTIVFLGVDLLGVQGETRNAARDLARQTGVRYLLGFDENAGLYSRFVTAGPLRAPMPVTIFVRVDGTVAHRHFGPLTAEELRRAIHAHLEE